MKSQRTTTPERYEAERSHDSPPRLRVEDFSTQSPAMRRCLQLAEFAARSDVPVLVLGETGTGKTLLAHAIHLSSRRARHPFVSFNTSAMSETLLESQLFGHERGAFTGAIRSVRGKFELADEGTLFLDEIADMSPLAQAKILRAVEYGEFERLGSETLRRSSARIIAATNCRLRERVDARQFREDLFHRLKGLTVTIPPLRERAEDLPLLIASELRRSAAQLGKHVTQIEPAAMNRLLRHPWPGNLRELHHTLRTLVLFVEHGVVTIHHVMLHEAVEEQSHSVPQAKAASSTSQPETTPPAATEDWSLATAVQRHVRHVYEACQCRQREAARRLGISRSTLVRHLRRRLDA